MAVRGRSSGSQMKVPGPITRDRDDQVGGGVRLHVAEFDEVVIGTHGVVVRDT